jgi:hypothetical protein
MFVLVSELGSAGFNVDPLLTYPLWAVLTGSMFIGSASRYWGSFYVIGCLSYLLALAMPFHLSWAPLELGVLVSSLQATAGLYLFRLKNIGEM